MSRALAPVNTRQCGRRWLLRRLAARLVHVRAAAGEWVALDCETTGLDRQARPRSSRSRAVRIDGNRAADQRAAGLLVRPQARRLSADSVRVHRLRERDLAVGLGTPRRPSARLLRLRRQPAAGRLLPRVRRRDAQSRDLADAGRAACRSRQIEVSAMYYEWRSRRLSRLPAKRASIDLRFDDHHERARRCRCWEAHDALNDAVMAGLAFVKLRGLVGR